MSFRNHLAKVAFNFSQQRIYRIVNPFVGRVRYFSAIEELVMEKKAYIIKMPELMDAKDGKVTKWLKKEGDAFNAGEPLCEISTAGLLIAFESEQAGVLIEKLVNEGQIVEVHEPIAHAAINKRAYSDYIDHKRIESIEEVKKEETDSIVLEQQEKLKKPDALVLMREIKHLIQEGHIQDGSELAKQLQSLARKGDPSLLSVFQASFDGIAFNQETFDVKFFLENAQAIVSEKK